jgi:hypothetical protein
MFAMQRQNGTQRSAALQAKQWRRAPIHNGSRWTMVNNAMLRCSQHNGDGGWIWTANGRNT